MYQHRSSTATAEWGNNNGGRSGNNNNNNNNNSNNNLNNNNNAHHYNGNGMNTSNHRQATTTINWQPLPPMLVPRTNNSSSCSNVIAVPISNTRKGASNQVPFGLVVMGGQNANDNNNDNMYNATRIGCTIELLEWKMQRWWSLPALEDLQDRLGYMVATLDNILLLCGGYTNTNNMFFDTVHRYTFAAGDGTDCWKQVTCMNSTRWCGAAIGLPHHNTILVMGGRGQEGSVYQDANFWKFGFTNELNTVEAYDIVHDSWTTMSSTMNQARFGCAAVAIGRSRVLVLGGYNGTSGSWLTSCEVYDYEHDTWTQKEVPDMPRRVRFPTATIVNDTYIIVTGQVAYSDKNTQQSQTHNLHSQSDHSAHYHHRMNSTMDMSLLQCYNKATNTWIVVPTSFDICKCTLASIGQDVIALGASASSNNFYNMNNNLSNPFEDDYYHSEDDSSSYVRHWNALSDVGFLRIWDNQQQQQQQQLPPNTITINDQQGQEDRLSTATPQAYAVAVPLVDEKGQQPHPMQMQMPPQQRSFDRPSVSNGTPQHPLFAAPSTRDRLAMASSQDSVAGASASGSTASTANLSSGAAAYPPSAPASVATGTFAASSVNNHPHTVTSSSNATTTTATTTNTTNNFSVNTSGSTFRTVENETTVDNYGVQVLYSGQVSRDSGKPHGKGKMKWFVTGDVYSGQFVNGARDGYGQMFYANGDVFEGMFHEDMKEGRGHYKYKDGRQYSGSYAEDVAHDVQGTLTWSNGTIYVGKYTKGKRTGAGTIQFPNNVRYQGEFVNGKYSGRGQCRFADGSVYDGEWKNGKAHGLGRLVNAQGQVVHDGAWENDGPVM